MKRKYKNDPNKFCNICGKVVISDRQSNITFCEDACFGMNLGDHDQAFGGDSQLLQYVRGRILSAYFLVFRWCGRREEIILL